ncbi:MAG: ATP-binding protein [Lachnospiraceae bacterium]|nr:ATP-binding protein [Lachnospiraceae bacterium]
MALSPAQYIEIMRGYDQTRLRNQDLLHKRQEEIYQKIPGFQDTDRLIASRSVAAGKARLRNDEHAIERLHTEISELSEQKRRLLVSYGYPKNYLDPVYRCRLCQDTGYIGNEKCQCFKQAIVDYIYAQSNIRELLEKENFSHFQYNYYSDKAVDGNPSPRANIESVVSLCWDFIYHFGELKKNNILFLGNAGVGKTFLSHCIAYELINKAYTVLYLTSFQLFDLLKQHAFHRENDPMITSMEELLSCDLLIIDDLGTELNNSFISSQLFLCMNERLLRRKSTIISTNLSLGQLSQSYTERILSRIMENYQILNIYGEDIRLLKALGK